MAEWYESFFDALAHDVWRGLVPEAHSDAEAQFIADALALEPDFPARLLDAPSGDGRLALRLAAMGHHITGVDLSSVAVDRINESGVELGVPAHAVLGDLRELREILPADVSFDGAYCMGNSFGYLDDEGTAKFVKGVAAALRPGARFVIDHPMAAECILAHYGDSDSHRVGDVALSIENIYEATTSTVVATMTLEHAGETAERTVRHRVTTCAQVVHALDTAGFDIIGLFGGIDGELFTVGSPTLVVLAARR
ncbi:MAG TPA: class I SAM-dependent methyltransferase [Acidimicrobiales bacterium]|nr:class I SAM-dependent methyltransferase [Acidimicrobiales bacterium]